MRLMAKELMMKEKNNGDSKLAGPASSIVGLVDYRDGSIVSRTLIDIKAGTATVFAFDWEQKLSEHTTAFDALHRRQLVLNHAKQNFHPD